MDTDLPGIVGHTLCKKIKSDQGLGDPIILTVSDLHDPQEEKLIIEQDADTFWPKPLDHKAMARAIKELENERRG